MSSSEQNITHVRIFSQEMRKEFFEQTIYFLLNTICHLVFYFMCKKKKTKKYLNIFIGSQHTTKGEFYRHRYMVNWVIFLINYKIGSTDNHLYYSKFIVLSDDMY